MRITNKKEIENYEVKKINTLHNFDRLINITVINLKKKLGLNEIGINQLLELLKSKKMDRDFTTLITLLNMKTLAENNIYFNKTLK